MKSNLPSKKATKTCCSHRQVAFYCSVFFFCTSWCVNIWIRCDMVPFHPCNLVTNYKLWNKMLSKHACGTNAHTHPCTHPHPYTLTKRLCPCWMFLAVFGVETFQSGHMTCAHPSAHQDPQQWLSTVQGVTKGSEGWWKQRERRVKATRGEKSDGSEGRVEWSQQGERRAKGGGNMGRKEQRAEENTGREEWRIQGERSAKRQKEQTKRMKLVSGKEDATL